MTAKQMCKLVALYIKAVHPDKHLAGSISDARGLDSARFGAYTKVTSMLNDIRHALMS